MPEPDHTYFSCGGGASHPRLGWPLRARSDTGRNRYFGSYRIRWMYSCNLLCPARVVSDMIVHSKNLS